MIQGMGFRDETTNSTDLPRGAPHHAHHRDVADFSLNIHDLPHVKSKKRPQRIRLPLHCDGALLGEIEDQVMSSDFANRQ